MKKQIEECPLPLIDIQAVRDAIKKECCDDELKCISNVICQTLDYLENNGCDVYKYLKNNNNATKAKIKETALDQEFCCKKAEFRSLD
tara:strand:+ start:5208 stop:5471 length:264 start_codon:yes stop_codon:yes gene_type:complete